MRLCEVFNTVPDYLITLQEDHAISLDISDIPDFNPRYSKVVGTIDNRDVWCSRYYPGYHVFGFIDNDQVQAFVVIKDDTINDCHPLTRLWSVTSRSTTGYITALVVFLIQKLQLKLIISDDEPLTKYGWNWLIKAVQRRVLTAKNAKTGNILTYQDIKQDKDLGHKTDLAVILEGEQCRYPLFGNGYRQLSEPNLYID